MISSQIPNLAPAQPEPLELPQPTDYSLSLKGLWRSWLARMHDTHEVTGSSPVRPIESSVHLCFSQTP